MTSKTKRSLFGGALLAAGLMAPPANAQFNFQSSYGRTVAYDGFSYQLDIDTFGSDLDTVAADVLERLLAGGGELVTIVGGEGSAELARRTADGVEERHPHVDVMVYDGGQQRYPLLMSVE